MADNTPDGWVPAFIPDHEVWATIPTHANYEVSTYGRVRTKARRVFCISPKGNHFKRFKSVIKRQQLGGRVGNYPRVTLQHPARNAYVHHIVAETFIGPRPPNTLVLHRDDNGQNCRLDNIRYGDPDENQLDRYINRVAWSYPEAPF